MVWFALISSFCVISAVVVGCLISKTLSLQSRSEAAVGPPESFVVGRPISSKDHPSEDPVQGVLVGAAAASR